MEFKTQNLTSQLKLSNEAQAFLKLYEYEAKNILKQYGLPVPKSTLITSANHAIGAAIKLKPPFAVKAQVLVAGRGKAGGILFADSAEAAGKTAKKMLKTNVKDTLVRKVLIEEKQSIKKELYCGITLDRFSRSYVFIASAAGGMEIEKNVEKSPQAIQKVLINPQQGFHTFQARQIARKLGYRDTRLVELAKIFEKIYRANVDYDAELIEINPLAETDEGAFVALDARIIIDDNALFRHPKYKKTLLEEERDRFPQETEALKKGLAYVKLNGNIGVIGNGAGLVMATLDMIRIYGGRPANFLDLGGGAPANRIAAALDIVLSDSNVKALFINILGGITRCDEVARGIIEAKKKQVITKPLVVRLVGTNEVKGKRMLEESGIHVLDSMEKAASRVYEIVKKEE
jgi:succinyl-CoA synthetase beta subunit